MGLCRPNFGTFLSESSERKAQQKFRASGCVNADGFIFSSTEKQLAVLLDSNIFVSSRLIAFAVKSRCKTMSRQGDELFLACVVKDSRSRFALVEIGPPLRHVIFVIQRQRYPSVVPVVWCLHSRYSF